MDTKVVKKFTVTVGGLGVIGLAGWSLPKFVPQVDAVSSTPDVVEYVVDNADEGLYEFEAIAEHRPGFGGGGSGN